jgi:hypothetical protein
MGYGIYKALELVLGRQGFSILFEVLIVIVCVVGVLYLMVTMWALLRPKGWVAQKLHPAFTEFLEDATRPQPPWWDTRVAAPKPKPRHWRHYPQHWRHFMPEAITTREPDSMIPLTLAGRLGCMGLTGLALVLLLIVVCFMVYAIAYVPYPADRDDWRIKYYMDLSSHKFEKFEPNPTRPTNP